MRDEYFKESGMVLESGKDQLPGCLPICGMPSLKKISIVEIEDSSSELELIPPAKKSKK
jgi:hypothetical protein